MRLGVIVRGDRRGLAYQTGELYRALRPDVTVSVDISPLDPAGRWSQDFEQYPDAIVTLNWDSPHHACGFSDEALEALLSCDVIYSAETMYDARLPRLATERGIPTIRHINCELYSPEGESHPWYPTSWRLPNRPEGPTVPVPIPDERIRGPAGEGLVLHTAGWKAAYDRNGTQLVRNAIRRGESKWRVTAQYGRAVGSREDKAEVFGEVADRWELYDGCSMLVLPRRYGGLCLPAQEAAARGLALVMTDIIPQSEWPIVPLDVHRRFTVRQRHVEAREIVYADPNQIAKVADSLTGDALWIAQESAVNWAESLAWSKWAAEYRRLFSEAIEEM